MGFIGWVISIVVVAIICRALRSKWEAVDWIAYLLYLLVLILFVCTWVSEGFWAALLTGLLGCLAIAILFGIGGGTEVRMFGHKYTLTCDKCGYENLEITEYTDLGVVTRCKRCGETCHHILNH